VSKTTRWADVNQPETTIAANIGSLCTPSTSIQQNPIDDFYQHVQDLIKRSSSSAVQGDMVFARLLLLDLVSTSELYFRRVFAGLVNLCPLCRRNAADQLLALGAVEYYGDDDLGYALLENTSFVNTKEIKKRTESILGLKIKDNTSVAAALGDFSAVCHLRHAAVHSRGEIAFKNANEIGVETSERLCLCLTPLLFQRPVTICQNAVRAYNRFVYREVVERWIGEGILDGAWAEDKALFRPLHSFFASKTDGSAPANPYLAYRALRPSVLSANAAKKDK